MASIRYNTPRKKLFPTSSNVSNSSNTSLMGANVGKKDLLKHTFALNLVLFGCMVAYSTYQFGASNENGNANAAGGSVSSISATAPAPLDDGSSATYSNHDNNLHRSLLRSTTHMMLDDKLPRGSGYGHHLSLDLVIPDNESSVLINPSELQSLTEKWCSQAKIYIASTSTEEAEEEGQHKEPTIQFFPKSQGIMYMTTFTNDDGYLTLQTYPSSSKIMIDLLLRGNRDRAQNLKTELLPLLAQSYGGDLSKSIYSIKERGIHSDDDEDEDELPKTSPYLTQFHPREILALHQFKSLVFETHSPFQHIAIYDHHDFAEESQDVTTTTRSLFLDGVMQSNVDDEEKYHETLVHPAMLTAHTRNHQPKRVLIVGGGEGGTLRETLKYKSVETTTMVDLDKGVVDASRTYLPSYNNCTTFGAASGDGLKNCFDDPRTELYTEDFIGWFGKHIGNDICDQRRKGKYAEDKLYDVIILDLLDTEELPEDQEWAQHLYSDLFFQRLACVMTTHGVLVTQFGEGPAYDGGPDDGPDKKPVTQEESDLDNMFLKKIKTIQTQANLFEHTKVYDNFIPAFRAPWAFAVSMVPNVLLSTGKDSKENNTKTAAAIALANFQSSPVYINAKLKKVFRPGASTEYYDGSSQYTFQMSNADWTSYYCKAGDTKKFCLEIQKFFQFSNVEEYFTEEENESDGGAGGAWVAEQAIPKGHIAVLLPSQTQQERDIDSIVHKHDCSSEGIINMVHASHEKPWSTKIWEDSWNPVYVDHEEEFRQTFVATRDIKKGESIVAKEWCQEKETKKSIDTVVKSE